jgi:hypothetical protein
MSFSGHLAPTPFEYMKKDLRLQGWTNMGDRLYAGQVMYQNSYLVSRNQKYVAWMQPDSNFVVYKLSSKSYGSSGYEKEPIFASSTSTRRKTFLMYQLDGNVVVYIDQTWLWSSGFTSGRYRSRMCSTSKCQLVLQDDGSLVAFKTISSDSSKHMEDVAYWSSTNMPPQSNFDSVTSSSYVGCPLLGPQSYLTYNLLLQSNPMPNLPEPQSQLTDVTKNFFTNLEASNPEAVTNISAFLYKNDQLNLWTSSATGQKVYYQTTKQGYAQYAGSVVHPLNVRTGDFSPASRENTTFLARLEANSGTLPQGQVQTMDAGYLLPPQFGNSFSGSLPTQHEDIFGV